ncbi:alpha/beta fold hydrolase [Geomesophilobacter sediminis]|uniref:Alpha/beta hydrolase n=1 Tax=Geomesophilobacter sediminis TaxID=2798584 RepID=A0A8J7LU11_9BACT|nr:alpha/beta hydrolase [Geomesophilobacter sediminis]MBJ6724049.1 alpha/beta hydrolase [Geomesophilobacter sediminis]
MFSAPRSYAISKSEILRYQVHGTGPLKLVLIHGLASRSECWTDLLPLFPEDRYTVYLLDLLGSGESSKPANADYSIPAHAVRVLEFLEHASLRGAALVGHSMGGAIVLMAAIEAQRAGQPGLLGAIVVMAGPGFIQRLPLMAEIFQSSLAAKLFVALYAPDAWIKIGLRAAYYDQRLVDREHIARYAPCYRDRDAKRALVETCRQLVPPAPDQIASAYPSLRLPVLLLWGRHDRIVPLSQGERLDAVLPDSRLVVLEACGHNPMEERPEETFRVIDQFIGGLS